jgi:hypothetical protein
MRTRTLLILAVCCGLAILVAGSLQLLRVTGDGDAAADLAIGSSARAGDLDVTVESADERDGLLRVGVRVSGVDDVSGLDSFRLVVSGEVLEPLTPAQAGDGACGALTVAEQRCDLVFGVADVEGSVRVLIVRRGEDQHRWDLRGPA